MADSAISPAWRYFQSASRKHIIDTNLSTLVPKQLLILLYEKKKKNGSLIKVKSVLQ